MSKLKVFIAALFATVCIDSTPTSALAVSYQEKINDSQSTGNPSFDAHNLLDALYADKAYDDLVRIAQSSPTIEPKCEGLRDGAKCWKELANLPGCFVWEDNLNMAQSLTWSGKCNNGVGGGRGTLVWTSNGISHQQVGTITNGKQNGFWTTRDPDGGEGDGPFVDGEQHGYWKYSYSNGAMREGPFVRGKPHGHWKFRDFDGFVYEGSFVDGEEHGRWKFRDVDGSVSEGSYSKGKQRGPWTVRYPDGRVKTKNDD